MALLNDNKIVASAVLITALLYCLLIVSAGQANENLTDRNRSSERPPARSATIQLVEKECIIMMPVQPNEMVLLAYADGSGSPAYLFGGIRFQAETEGLRLRLRIVKPDHDKTWWFWHGVEEVGKGWRSGGGPIRPAPEGEVPLSIGHIVVPVNTEGVEVHLFPFMIANGRVGSMMVIIGQDRDQMRKAVPFQINRHYPFDWETGFRDASSFLLRKPPR